MIKHERFTLNYALQIIIWHTFEWLAVIDPADWYVCTFQVLPLGMLKTWQTARRAISPLGDIPTYEFHHEID
jgi:hypothetical protein